MFQLKINPEHDNSQLPTANQGNAIKLGSCVPCKGSQIKGIGRVRDNQSSKRVGALVGGVRYSMGIGVQHGNG